MFNVFVSGHLDTIKVLLSFGAFVDATAKNGWTPLHRASAYGNYLILRIQKKMWLAIRHGDVRSLLSRHYLNNNWTFVHSSDRWNCYFSGKFEVAKILLEYGANVNLRNQDDDMPLHLALQNGKFRIQQNSKF